MTGRPAPLTGSPHRREPEQREPIEIAAGIIVYRPAEGPLLALVAATELECERTYLFLNGPLDLGLRERLEAFPTARIIEAAENLGLGCALNLLALHAILDEAGKLIFFDQDTTPAPGSIRALAQAYDRAVGENVALSAVGPRLVGSQPDAAGAATKTLAHHPDSKRRPAAELEPVRFLPTSGMLLDPRLFLALGGARTDFFVDGIDVEWSFRAAGSGYPVWLDPKTAMVHRLGTDVVRIPWLRAGTPQQSDLRLGLYIRNIVYGLRLRHIPLAWRLRSILYLFVQLPAFWLDRGLSVSFLRLIAGAVVDGLRGRLGPPAGTAPTERQSPAEQA